MPTTTPFKKHITAFLEYLEVDRGLSNATITNYSFYLHRFADYIEEEANVLSVDKITKELVHKFRLYLNRLTDYKDEELLKKNTQNYHLIALRGFLKYLAKNDIKSMAAEKIELAKQQERHVEFLEGDDLSRILAAPLKNGPVLSGAEGESLPGLRDKAMLELFFSTGLRVSELAKLNIEDVNLNKDEFSIRGKGKKVRIVFLSDEAKTWIKKYLDKRQDLNPFLFINVDRASKNQDGGLTPRSIERIVAKYAKNAGIMKQVTPHTLRHSYATDLLINGADIRSVQAMLGHSSITTTQVYTHITDKQLREVHKNFHDKKKAK